MALSSFFETVQASPLGQTISASSWMFPTLETAHVFALVLVAGTILIVDLRLLGVASKNQRVTALIHELLPWTWGAFALAAVSGALLFTSRAADYMTLSYFIGKFVVMAIAGLNMAAFHFVGYRKVDRWDLGSPPVSAKLAGAVSLLCWMAIIVLGRNVGFNI